MSTNAELRDEIARAIDAIRQLLTDYRTEGCPDPNCNICQRSREAEAKARACLEIQSDVLRDTPASERIIEIGRQQVALFQEGNGEWRPDGFVKPVLDLLALPQVADQDQSHRCEELLARATAAEHELSAANKAGEELLNKYTTVSGALDIANEELKYYKSKPASAERERIATLIAAHVTDGFLGTRCYRAADALLASTPAMPVQAGLREALEALDCIADEMHGVSEVARKIARAAAERLRARLDAEGEGH